MLSGHRAGLVAVWEQVAACGRAGCAGEGDAGPVWAALRDKFYIDELYGATVIAFYHWWARGADWLDRRVWGGLVTSAGWRGRFAVLHKGAGYAGCVLG